MQVYLQRKGLTNMPCAHPSFLRNLFRIGEHVSAVDLLDLLAFQYIFDRELHLVKDGIFPSGAAVQVLKVKFRAHNSHQSDFERLA